jgi:hypothetical protein
MKANALEYGAVLALWGRGQGSDIGGGGTRKTKTRPLLIHATQPNVPSTDMFGLVFRLESQGLLKESELGINAMQVPGVKCGGGHSLKIESTSESKREPALWKNRGRGSRERIESRRECRRRTGNNDKEALR